MLLEYVIITALRKSANLPLKDAAAILLEALDKIMEGDIEPDDDDDDTEDDSDDDDDIEEDDDDDAALSEAHANVMAAHQKLSEAMSGEEILAIQRQMDEALKAGNVTEYMRLATELQMKMLNSLGS